MFNKLHNKFVRPKSRFEKAVSWAFFNKGNKVDQTKLRITDGTPVHSTGIHRLKKDFLLASSTALIASVALVTKGDMEAVIDTVIGCSIAVSTAKRGNNKELSSKFKDKCFDTAPNEDDVSDIVDIMEAKSEQVSGLIGIPVDMTIFGGCALAFKSAILLSCGTVFLHDGYLKYSRFKKVTTEEWNITSTPTPEKIALKEEVSVRDLIEQVLPQPQFTPSLPGH